MQIRDLIPWGHDGAEASRQADKDNPILALQRDINRVFGNFWSRVERPGDLARTFESGMPRVDAVDADDAIEVTVELPGMDENDIDVSVAEGVLTIKGEKKAAREKTEKGYYLAERTYGAFYRAIPLPPGISTEGVTAEFKKGVLTIKVPKSPEAQAKVKKVEVKAG